MPNAVKQGITILAALLLGTIIFAAVILVQSQKLQNQNKSLTGQVADYQSKQTQLIAEGAKLKEQVQTLNAQLAEKDKDHSKYQSQYQELKDKYDQINGQVSQITRERDDLKDRTSTITKERDRLMKELQDRPEKVVEKIVEKPVEKIVYRDNPAAAPAAAAATAPATAPVAAPAAQEQDANGAPVKPAAAQGNADAAAVVAQAQADAGKQQKDEAHWAEILKEKAALEIELDKAKKELDQSAIQIVELKKQSSDFQLEIDKLKNEKDEILRKIKYGEDLADNLSIELARAKNDQKFLGERADKLNAENEMLRSQVKQLNDTKVGLEKTIQRLNNDKEEIQKKLVESESVIQSRIDDIWKIKKNVDQRFANMPGKNQVELSPIVVNANGGTTADNGQQQQQPASQPKSQGHIVSINTDNNFVIIDIGDKDGSKIGNAYRVFRGSKEIARLEVIQVRRDISAADIKKRTTALQVGDVVR
jgi:predicted  nucleic acid-binding Zn-ribbon protein